MKNKSNIVKECKKLIKEAKKLNGNNHLIWSPDEPFIPRAKGHLTYVEK